MNGELRHSASTLDQMYTPRQMVAMVCEHFGVTTLARGTWLLTGTPSGIALNATARQRRLVALLPRRLAIRLAVLANRPKRSFLRTGDQVVCRAIGTDAFNIASAIHL